MKVTYVIWHEQIEECFFYIPKGEKKTKDHSCYKSENHTKYIASRCFYAPNFSVTWYSLKIVGWFKLNHNIQSLVYLIHDQVMRTIITLGELLEGIYNLGCVEGQCSRQELSFIRRRKFVGNYLNNMENWFHHLVSIGK